MIFIKDICLSFGSQTVFDHISLSIESNDRIGLVGRNGSGKSTFLKALVQEHALDSGTISIAANGTLSYMAQEMVLQSTKTIFEETMRSYQRIGTLREKAIALEILVEQEDPQAVQEYAVLMEELRYCAVDDAIREVKEMLLGLGFKETQLHDGVDTLSVGWQMRIVLAKLLLQKADFYLFDEPTNHLDIVAKDWFLDFLKKAPFGFMLVCHDRYFLDQVCDSIFELERGKGTWYKGNYTDYEQQKEHNREALEAAFHQQQRDLVHKQKIMDKFRATASKASTVKNMQKAIDKMEKIELPPTQKTVRFSFSTTSRPERIILEVKNLSFAFGEKTIFEHVDFKIERGNKIAIIAPNGGGKTTLFNVLIGRYPQKTGTITFGYTVKKAIFEQEQHKVLDPRKTILEEIFAGVSHKSEQQIRTFLGSFLFSRDEVLKKTGVLSGGERNRVSMVKVLLQDAHFLMLDEPTNHLDIQSKEILLQALQQFEGTLLFVSHDQAFVNALADHIFELTPQGIHAYEGNYESYKEQKKYALTHGETTDNHQDLSKQKKNNSESTALKKEIQQWERSIAKCEQALEKIHASFADLDYGTPAFDEAQKRMIALEKELAQATSQWEQLVLKQKA